MKRRDHARMRRASKGISLLEVLVSLLVFSFGLLGSASLQITGLRLNHSAYLRTQAVTQAYDLADRIRANQAGVSAGAYDNITTTPADPGCGNSGCTPAEQAQLDAFQWNSANASLLPSGIGQVSGNGADSTFTVTVMWDDEGTGATGTGCDSEDPDDLKCFTFDFRP